MELNQIYNTDCMVGMQNIPDGKVDLIITDPPFAIDFKRMKSNYNRKSEHVLEGYQDIKKEEYYDFTLNWMREAYRVLSDQGSMYIISGWTNLKDILNAVDAVGFHTLNHLVWKYQFGVFTKRRFVTSHYHILLVTKHPKRYTFNKQDHYPEDVFEIKRQYWRGEAKTPTKLPVDLVRKLMLYSSNEGDLVLDPFMGSGTVAVVACMENRQYLGYEIVEDYCTLANTRVSSIAEGGEGGATPPPAR